LVFVIGSDLADQIPHWLNADQVLTSARIAIAPRKGWPLQKDHLLRLKSLGGQIEVLPLNIPATASSDIRHETTTSQIPKSVLRILLQQNLYGFSMNKQ